MKAEFADERPICTYCGAAEEFNVDFSSGCVICTVCAAVQPEQIIDVGKEWRDFENDDKGTDKQRAEKVDDDFHSLGTGISQMNYGSYGISAAAKNLSRYSLKAVSETDKVELHLKEAFIKVNELAEVIQLPSIIKQTAKEILKHYEKFRDRSMKGYRKDAFIVAVLLIACKQEQGGRTLKSISKSTNIDEREIKRFYKMLLKDPKLITLGESNRKTAAQQAEDLVEVFCNQLKQPFSIAKEAREVATRSINFLEGKRPSSVAAASILFVLNAFQLPCRQQDLAVIAGISANTLRNVYKELSKNVEQLPPHLFSAKGQKLPVKQSSCRLEVACM